MANAPRKHRKNNMTEKAEEMKKHSRYENARRALIFWCLFIGIGAVAGAVGMLTAPDGSNLGMQTLLPYFQVLPFAGVLFQNFIFPGIALLIVNGLTNLTAAFLLLQKKKAGVICGGIFGVTLMAWIVIQFVIFPPNFMSVTYFIFGLIQAATGYAAYVFAAQESFVFDAAAYPHIGSRPGTLVVYFSRMGYTRRVAYEKADRLGAAVFELRTSEKTENTTGFWWCGRYGMHGWPMPVTEMPDVEKYDKIVLCSPIWVFGLAAPVREFCRRAAGKIHAVDYVFVHFMNCRFTSVAARTDHLLGVRHSALDSICCRLGRCKALR